MKILTDEELKQAAKELGIPIEEVRTMYIRAISANKVLLNIKEKEISNKKCYYCGTILLDKARICDRCGGPVV